MAKNSNFVFKLAKQLLKNVNSSLFVASTMISIRDETFFVLKKSHLYILLLFLQPGVTLRNVPEVK